MSWEVWSLKFDIELREDMHAGSGTGRLGLVDDTQARDSQGRPIVWSATLRGLLREAGEDWLLARARCGEPERVIESDREALYRLIGRPVNEATSGSERQRGQCIIGSLRLMGETDRVNCFHTWSSTARQVHSRAPMEKTLRSVEMARAGLRFTSEIRIEGPAGPDLQRSGEVLQQCLKRIVAIGGGRTRGWGQIRLCNTLQLTRLPDASPGEIESLVQQVRQAGSAKQPVRIRLRLRNLEPLVLSSVALVGNLTGTLSYVPGSALRGAILTYLSARDAGAADRFADPARMRLGNGYFVPEEVGHRDDWGTAVRVLPLPLSLRQPKAGHQQNGGYGPEELTQPWWARPDSSDNRLGAADERDAVAHDVKQIGLRKRIKTEECLVRSGDQQAWQRFKPRKGVLLHNRVPTYRIDPDVRGRSIRRGEQFEYEDNGAHGFQDDALFSHEVIWDNQTFLVDIDFAGADSAAEFLQLSSGLLAGSLQQRHWLRVGRGGQPVRVEAAAVIAMGPAGQPGPQAGEAVDPSAQAGQLTITLTSDLVARDQWLCFLTDLTPRDWIDLVRRAAKAGNVELPPLDAAGIVYDRERSVVDWIDVYGFNSATGMTRSPAIAIRRGSVFVLQADSEDGRENLNHLRTALLALDRGGVPLGERTAEGYGRFWVDLDVHRRQAWDRWLGQLRRERVSDAPVGRDLGWRWEEDVLEQVAALERDFARARGSGDGASSGDLGGKRWPSVTQWQWLRHRAEVAASRKDIDQLMDQLREHATRLSGASWSAEVGNKTIVDLLIHQLAKLQGEISAAAASSQATHPGDRATAAPDLHVQAQRLFLTAIAQAETARLREGRCRGGEG